MVELDLVAPLHGFMSDRTMADVATDDRSLMVSLYSFERRAAVIGLDSYMHQLRRNLMRSEIVAARPAEDVRQVKT